MAAVVNDRDVLLQAAPVRLLKVNLPDNITIPGFTGVVLVADSNFFKISAAGVVTPAQIQLNAVLRQITGVVTWTVLNSGGTLAIPIGGSNVIRYVLPENMTGDTMTVQASVTDIATGILYTAQYVFSKIRDGSTGAPGVRGMATVTVQATSPAWSDTLADSAINSFTGSATKILGDTVSEYYADTWTETRYWTGTAWIVLTQLFNGNMLVRGSIGANAMAANSITATNAALGTAVVGTANIQNGAISSLKIGSVVQSDNYNPSVAGWIIRKDGSAEFNGVVISRPQVVASGDFATGAGSAHFFGPPWGDPFTAEVKWYIDTGYNDVYDVTTLTRPGYIAKAICLQSTAGWSSDPGGNKFYDVPVEAIPWSSVDHFKVGVGGVAGGRMLMQLRVPMPRNVWGSITSIRIDVLRWSLMRVT